MSDVVTAALSRRPLVPHRWTSQPGWPLFALFTWYPLWWILGLGEMVCLIFAMPMAVDLVRRGNLRAPRAFGVWLLFVFWVVGGILVLQVHAPGTVPGGSSTRYFTFLYRLLWYVAATVVLLYIINTRKELSNRRICLAMGNMFVVVALGGLLGVLAPHLEFRSVLEYVLPGAIRSNGFVHSLIHPVTAQVQDFLGYSEARPSAPFAYTNEWGLTLGSFLPFFVLSWCRADAGWRRTLAPFILLLGAVAVVFSLNRGLWLALGVSAVYVTIRYVLLGHVRVLAALGGGIALLGVLIALSPLGALIMDRLAHPNSNQGRTNLGTLTVSSVLAGSPIMGFGSTRNVLGNFQSIAAGASSRCPGCSPPPLGTQGQLWLVLFSAGLVGAVLFLTFLFGQLLRYIRLNSPYAIAAQTVILVQIVTMAVYDSIGPALFALMVAVGLLCRQAASRAEIAELSGVISDRRVRAVDTSLVRYADAFRRQRWRLVAFGLLGAVLGVLVHASQGSTVVASQSVLIPPLQSSVQPAPGQPAGATDSTPPSATTPDTYAGLVTSDGVVSALAATQPGASWSDLASRIQVAAVPNTRILHVSFTAHSASAALDGINAVTKSYVSLLRGLSSADASALTQARAIHTATVNRPRDGWIISAASGAMLAMALSLMYGLLVGERRSRISRSVRAGAVAGLPVLGRIKPALTPLDLARAKESLDRLSVSHVLAVPTSVDARQAAGLLDDAVEARGRLRTTNTAVVASTRERLGGLTRMHQQLSRTGQQVAGVVLVEEKAR